MTPTLEHRIVVLANFISLAHHLQSLNNLLSLMAVYLGLSLPAVENLKKTWAVRFLLVLLLNLQFLSPNIFLELACIVFDSVAVGNFPFKSEKKLEGIT
jgi:hypothetical protein